MNVKHLETKNTRLRSISLSGLSILCFLNQDVAGGTQYGSSKVDFLKSNIKVTLIRDGKEHLICQDNLKILGLASALNTRGQLAFFQNNDHFTKLDDGQSLLSFNLNFGGIINLKNDDEMIIEVKAQDGLFADGYLNSSYLQIKPLKAVGYERYIPFIRSYVVQASESSNQYNFGDNVIKLALLNFDKTNFEDAVISQLNFNSDRLSDSFDFADLVNMKESSFPRLPANLSAESGTLFEADQSFNLIEFGQKFNSVVIDAQFNPENVAAAKNYFVAWTYKTDLTLINRADAMSNKHLSMEFDKIASSSI